jgi:hypothetical protein
MPYDADVLKIAKAGEFYGNTFIEPNHIRTNWDDRTFEFVAHLPGGLSGWQDIFVLRRR